MPDSTEALAKALSRIDPVKIRKDVVAVIADCERDLDDPTVKTACQLLSDLPLLLALSRWALAARRALEAGRLATGAYVADYGLFSEELREIDDALATFPHLP